jgi:hypothetical protein
MSVDGYDAGIERLVEELQEILGCEDLYIINSLLIHELDYVHKKIGDNPLLLDWLDHYINFELDRRIEERI